MSHPATILVEAPCLGCGAVEKKQAGSLPFLCTRCIVGPQLDGPAGDLQEEYADRYWKQGG